MGANLETDNQPRVSAVGSAQPHIRHGCHTSSPRLKDYVQKRRQEIKVTDQGEPEPNRLWVLVNGGFNMAQHTVVVNTHYLL